MGKINLKADYLNRIGENLLFEIENEDLDFVHKNIFGLKLDENLELGEDFSLDLNIDPEEDEHSLFYVDSENEWNVTTFHFLSKEELKKIRPKVSIKKL